MSADREMTPEEGLRYLRHEGRNDTKHGMICRKIANGLAVAHDRQIEIAAEAIYSARIVKGPPNPDGYGDLPETLKDCWRGYARAALSALSRELRNEAQNIRDGLPCDDAILLDVAATALATEAGTAETKKIGSVHEGAVPEGETP